MTLYMVKILHKGRLRLLRREGFVARAVAEHALRKAVFNRFGRVRIIEGESGKYFRDIDGPAYGEIYEVDTGYTEEEIQAKIKARMQIYFETGNP